MNNEALRKFSNTCLYYYNIAGDDNSSGNA